MVYIHIHLAWIYDKSIGKYTGTMDPKRVSDFCIISRFRKALRCGNQGLTLQTSSPAMCLLRMIWGPKAYLLTFGIFCMRLNQPANDCFCTCFIPISNSKISGLKSDLRQTYSHINEENNDEWYTEVMKLIPQSLAKNLSRKPSTSRLKKKQVVLNWWHRGSG